MYVQFIHALCSFVNDISNTSMILHRFFKKEKKLSKFLSTNQGAILSGHIISAERTHLRALAILLML